MSGEKRLKILVSAYACAPNSGSDQAVAWWWITRCAERHDVTVLTCAAQRDVIQAEMLKNPLPITFEYVVGPKRLSPSGTEFTLERLRVYLWQLRAIPIVRRLTETEGFDLAQHLTIATWRAPSCLAFARIPFIFGPVSGSEVLPPGFAIHLGHRGLLWSSLRTALIRLAWYDPLVQTTLRRARVILASSPTTYQQLKRHFGSKVLFSSHAFRSLDLPALSRREPRKSDSSGQVVLGWMGQLISRKGLDLLLRALDHPRLSNCILAVLGDGPNRGRYERLADELGLGSRVRFHGHIPRDQAISRLTQCDIFVFTSLQDMMGQALSEAMQLGLPCVVMDWGGPAALAGEDGAVKVSVTTYSETCEELRSTLIRLCEDPSLRSCYSRKAIQRIDALTDPVELDSRREGVFAAALGQTPRSS